MEKLGGETYQVNYVINLQNNASAGINTFVSSINQLTTAGNNLQTFANKFNSIVSGFRKPMTLKVNIDNTMQKLGRVERALKRIDRLATKSGITLGTGSITGSPAPASRPAPVSRGNARWQSTGRIPNSGVYQLFGPARLNDGNIGILDMFKGMGIMYGISALGSGFREVVSQSVDYQNVMQTAKNILRTNHKGGGFGPAFMGMERIARDIGVETKFTAVEVAEMVKFLAMAGLDINAIRNSARPIADIALIGDSDLGQTADVMTNIMTAYGIGSYKMRNTADVMTRTFTMSNTTLMEMAESLKYAAPLLSLNNVPFETAAAMIGVLGDAGVKGSQAGTTIRTIMNNLMNPTKKQSAEWERLGIQTRDKNGNLRALNEIFGELNAAREAGLGVDIYKLFRLTATSGAGALMTHVSKWNQIIEENLLSAGLSNKLAEEKKNTVAGLWAQLKSAFIEGGLKTFEENDAIIRGYLHKGINWLKTDDFRDLLHDSVEFISSLANTLFKFTKIVVELYKKFEPLVKLWFKFQLYGKGAALVINAMRTFGGSFGYFLNPLLSGFSRNGMIAGGGANNGYIGGPALWFASHDKAWTGRGGGVRAHANMQLLNKYNKLAGLTGLSSMVGTGLGYFIGNNFAPETGGMWGSMIGMGLGALAPFIASNPVGWVVGAVAAVAGLTSMIVKANREQRELNKATELYFVNLGKLDFAKVDFNSTESVVNANIKNTLDLITDENTKLERQIELWDRLIKVQSGGQAEEKPEGGALVGSNLESKMKEFSDLYKPKNAWTATAYKIDNPAPGYTFYQNMAGMIPGMYVSSPSHKTTVTVGASTTTDWTSAGFRYNLGNGHVLEYWANPTLESSAGWENSTNAAMFGLSYAQEMAPIYGANLIGRLKEAKTRDEYKKILANFRTEYMPVVDYNKHIGDLTIQDILDKEHTIEDVLSYAEIGGPLAAALEKEIEMADVANSWFVQAFNEAKANGSQLDFETVRRRLYELGDYQLLYGAKKFFPEGYTFGTPEWIENVQTMLDFPNRKGEAQEEVERMYQLLVEYLNQMPEDYLSQESFMRLLNKTTWESLFNGTDEQFRPNLSGFRGFYAPIGTEGIKGYRWDAGKGLWYNTQNGMVAMPGANGFNVVKPSGGQSTPSQDADGLDYIKIPGFSQSYTPMPPIGAGNTSSTLMAYNSGSTTVQIGNITIEVKPDESTDPQFMAGMLKDCIVEVLSNITA